MLLRHPHLPKSSRLFTLAYGLLPWPGRQRQYLPLPVTSGSLSAFFLRCLSHTSLSNIYYRLTAAGVDFGLHLLTKSATVGEIIFPFGNGLSGHHGRVRWNECRVIIR